MNGNHLLELAQSIIRQAQAAGASDEPSRRAFLQFPAVNTTPESSDLFSMFAKLEKLSAVSSSVSVATSIYLGDRAAVARTPDVASIVDEDGTPLLLHAAESQHAEIVADCGNIFAQGYVTLATNDGQVVLVPTYRFFRGGVSFQF